MSKATYSAWYSKNKDRVSAKLRERYATDPEHRDRRRNKAKDSMRKSRQGEMTWENVASRLKMKEADLKKWCQTGMFPEPKSVKGQPAVFTDVQVSYVENLKKLVATHGRFSEQVGDYSLFVFANWND